MARKKVRKRNVSLRIGKHKSRKGGLTAAGRKKYNAATGSNLKAHSPEVVHARDPSVQDSEE